MVLSSCSHCRLRYIIRAKGTLATIKLLKCSCRPLLEHGRINLLPLISEKCGLITVYSWWVVQLEHGFRGVQLAHLNLSALERHNFWWHYCRFDLLLGEDGCVEEDVNEGVCALRLHPALELTILRDSVLDKDPVNLVHFTAVIHHALPDFACHA